MKYPLLVLLGALGMGGVGELATSLPKPSAKPYTVTGTVYYPTGHPTYDGSTIPRGKALTQVRWCALTHDLLRKTHYQFGDTLLVYGKTLPQELWGLYILRDKTHKRLHNRVDLLTPKGAYYGKWEGVKLRKFTVN